jgi:hypothetical protein
MTRKKSDANFVTRPAKRVQARKNAYRVLESLQTNIKSIKIIWLPTLPKIKR